MKRKRNLKQELWYLCYMEFINAILFICVYFANLNNLNIDFHPITLYPITLLSLILLEGSIYWFVCLKRVQRRDRTLYKNNVAQIFSFLNKLNLILFAMYIPIYIANIGKSGLVGKIVGLTIYIFALIELINYFYYRLSYYTKGWFGLKIVEPLVKLFTKNASKSQICKEISNYKTQRTNNYKSE